MTSNEEGRPVVRPLTVLAWPAVRKFRRFAPWGLGAALVLGLLAYGGVSYRVADGITKLERKPLIPAAEVVSPVHEDVSFRATDGLLLKGCAAKKGGIDRRRVAVVGESLGAGSAIMTVGLEPTIGPVVTDSAYADAYTVVSEVGTNYTGLPSWFTPGIVITSKFFFGLDVASVKPAEVVRAHPERAWLFIQCVDDKTVFAHHGRDLKAASANPETELWMVDGCDHVKAFTEHPAEWQQHVFTFLDRELGRAPGAASR